MLDSRHKPASGEGTPVQVRDGPAAVRGDALPPRRHWALSLEKGEGLGRRRGREPRVRRPAARRKPRTPRGRRIRAPFQHRCRRGPCRGARRRLPLGGRSAQALHAPLPTPDRLALTDGDRGSVRNRPPCLAITEIGPIVRWRPVRRHGSPSAGCADDRETIVHFWSTLDEKSKPTNAPAPGRISSYEVRTLIGAEPSEYAMRRRGRGIPRLPADAAIRRPLRTNGSQPGPPLASQIRPPRLYGESDAPFRLSRADHDSVSGPDDAISHRHFGSGVAGLLRTITVWRIRMEAAL